jgi:hypothetical protein
MDPIPGSILLFGSGETSPSGRKVFDHALLHLASRSWKHPPDLSSILPG